MGLGVAHCAERGEAEGVIECENDAKQSLICLAKLIKVKYPAENLIIESAAHKSML